MAIDIGELNLSHSLEAVLRKNGFNTVERLQELSMEDLGIINQMGDKAFERISSALEKYTEHEHDDISVSLYECYNARVSKDGERIFCFEGHALDPDRKDGTISVRPLALGKPLIYKSCQNCPHFNPMGPAIHGEERGWIKVKKRYI